MTERTTCDGIDCGANLYETNPRRLPQGWVSFFITVANSEVVAGHLCPTCWVKAHAVDMTQNRPELLKGLAPRDA